MAKGKNPHPPNPAVLPPAVPLIPPPTTQFKCDLCTASYLKPTALGIHKRNAHGIYGKSKAAITYRKNQERHAESHIVPRGRPKRSEIRTIQEDRQIDNNAISEVALAIAYGRLAQFCSGMASEYDVPPRLFTSRLFELVHRTPFWK